MQPRQLLIVAIAVLIAFGAAFGIAKAGGGDESNASGSLESAEVIEVGDATVSAGVADTGALPALQLPEKKPEQTADGGSTTTGPTATVAPTGTVVPTSTVPPSSGGGGDVTGGGGDLSGGSE